MYLKDFPEEEDEPLTYELMEYEASTIPTPPPAQRSNVHPKTDQVLQARIKAEKMRKIQMLEDIYDWHIS